MTEVSFGFEEWYGWHFPEMAKIIVDNIAYAKVVRAMGKSGVLSRSFDTDEL
jgi:nucleolar protein 58